MPDLVSCTLFPARLERVNVLAVFSITIMLILAGLNQVKHW